MLDEIRQNLDSAAELEKLYQRDKSQFARDFADLYKANDSVPFAQFWHARLNFDKSQSNFTASTTEILLIFGAILLSGTIAKFPEIFKIDETFFFTRNLGFIVFPVLTAYFAWRNSISSKKILAIVSATLASILFINFLPNIIKSDTVVLSSIHMVLFMWSVLGLAFVSSFKNIEGRLKFLKFNGDLVVISALIGIAGVALTGITIGLFSLIKIDITTFYFNYLIFYGIPAILIVGTYLTQINRQLVDKVSPVIAQIFSPIVLIMLISYLGAIVISGKDPYTDREFLLLFNLLLIGVMALIFFSIAGNSVQRNQWSTVILLCLAVITVVINCVALSAIIFRISEWGFTPNRTAVLGSNILMLINLVLICIKLFKVQFKSGSTSGVSNAIANYLPIYVVWTMIVTFVFPFLFGFA